MIVTFTFRDTKIQTSKVMPLPYEQRARLLFVSLSFCAQTEDA